MRAYVGLIIVAGENFLAISSLLIRGLESAAAIVATQFDAVIRLPM